MFYLVSQSQNGHRLVDFSDTAEALTSQIPSLVKDNPAATPVVYHEKALRGIYLVDGFGIVSQENDGYLVQLDDL